MEQHKYPRYTLEAASVLTGSEDESAVIVRFQGHIAAILVKLESSFHETLQGLWYLEAGFGPCAAAPQPFERLSNALAWIAARLDDQASDLVDLFNSLEAALIVKARAQTKRSEAD